MCFNIKLSARLTLSHCWHLKLIYLTFADVSVKGTQKKQPQYRNNQREGFFFFPSLALTKNTLEYFSNQEKFYNALKLFYL